MWWWRVRLRSNGRDNLRLVWKLFSLGSAPLMAFATPMCLEGGLRLRAVNLPQNLGKLESVRSRRTGIKGGHEAGSEGAQLVRGPVFLAQGE